MQEGNICELYGRACAHEDRTPFISCSICHIYPLQSMCCVLSQSGLTLCKPMDYSLPDSSVCGIFQARILELDAISFSRGLLSIIIPISLKLDMNSGQFSYAEHFKLW